MLHSNSSLCLFIFVVIPLCIKKDHMSGWFWRYVTVAFQSIRQSCIMGPSKLLQCHGGHGDFVQVLNYL